MIGSTYAKCPKCKRVVAVPQGGDMICPYDKSILVATAESSDAIKLQENQKVHTVLKG